MNARLAEVIVGAPADDGRIGYKDDLSGLNFGREQLPLTVLMERLLQSCHEGNPVTLYAGAKSIADYMPGFALDHRHDLLAKSDHPLMSIWIGNRVRIAAHWDLVQNIACVVGGRRRFTLFPIDQIANLYFGPVDFTPAGQPISLVDFRAPDLGKYPRFEFALKHAEVANLEPGDALYLPSLWIHHVEALDAIGVLVNYWWRPAGQRVDSPMLAMLHALRAIRELPEFERAGWRTLFDHYVFQGETLAMAHVPPHARGLLGPMTDEGVAQINSYLRQSLGLDRQ